MDPILRPDLTRVVLTGSESVGKSTLAPRLAAHFGVEYVPEFVRQYAKQKGAVLDFRDHGPIAHGQMALENEFAARARDLLLLDTDLVSTVVYCRHYFGRCPDFIVEAAVARRAHLYLLFDIDLPWVPDGIRDRGDQREAMHALFLETLAALGMNVETISGDDEARFAASIGAIDRLVQARSHDTVPPRTTA
jgi:NadR type nicotinamide-nucleotide adenylyltransferase